MSGRRSSSKITDDETTELIYKLQYLLPETRCRSIRRESTSKLLKETCSYINSIQREVNGLSDRLSDLIEAMDSSSPQAEVLRTLIR